jgi:Protein of unknown function (DUF1566)
LVGTGRGSRGASALLARADVKAECVQAATSAQNLRNRHELMESRAELLVCARKQCPGAVRSDCTRWLAEVNQSLPAVVVGAKDANGSDIVDAALSIDGKPSPRALDGQATSIDPGQHVLRFTAPGNVPVNRTVVIRQGEKNREITVVMVAADQTARPEPAASTAAASAPAGSAGSDASNVEREQRSQPSWSSQRMWALVVGGAGVAGAAVGTVFALRSKSKWNDAKQACGAGCGPGSPAYALNDQSKQAGTLAIVAFVASGVALATGVVLWLTAPHPKRGPAVAASIGIDYTASSPAIDATAFPTAPSAVFWSSSPQAGVSTLARYVDFSDGVIYNDSVSNAHRVRCVRATGAAPLGAQYTPSGATVLDNFTRLTWQENQSPNNFALSAAQSYCANLTLGGATSRLPSVKELLTLVDVSVATPGPTIDTTVFADTQGVTFWSSSPLATDASSAWYVSFHNGYTGSNAETASYWVHCVH